MVYFSAQQPARNGIDVLTRSQMRCLSSYHPWMLRFRGRDIEQFPESKSPPTGGSSAPQQTVGELGATRHCCALRGLIAREMRCTVPVPSPSDFASLKLAAFRLPFGRAVYLRTVELHALGHGALKPAITIRCGARPPWRSFALLNRLLTSRCDGHHKKCDICGPRNVICFGEGGGGGEGGRRLAQIDTVLSRFGPPVDVP